MSNRRVWVAGLGALLVLILAAFIVMQPQGADATLVVSAGQVVVNQGWWGCVCRGGGNGRIRRRHRHRGSKVTRFGLGKTALRSCGCKTAARLTCLAAPRWPFQNW